MKLTFNNFAKAYFLMAVTVLGWIGGAKAYIMAFHLLLFLIQFGIIFYPLIYFGMYFICKIGIHYNPNFGCRGDAQSIVEQVEEQMTWVKNKIKNLFL